MLQNQCKNNYVRIIGTVIQNPTYKYECLGIRYYELMLKVDRRSGNVDLVPVEVNEILLDLKENYVGRSFEVRGKVKPDKDKLVIETEFFKEIIGQIFCSNNNIVFLDGRICKSPSIRNNIKGDDITEFVLKIGNKTCIPCVAWYEDAKTVVKLDVGDHVIVKGLFQSRVKEKRISGVKSQKKIVYEISVRRIGEKYDSNIYRKER